MGYLHIENLYRPQAQAILLFKEVYALEKVHGTSAHVRWDSATGVAFFSGGVKHSAFLELFDAEDLVNKFKSLGHDKVVLFGEAYGGSCQGMSSVYGNKLRFVVFDVKIGETWLAVPNAEQVTTQQMGLEFVPYRKVSTDLSALDAERDRTSDIAERRGIFPDPQTGKSIWREGIVLRPLVEVTLSNGDRLIAKHKQDSARETATVRKVVDPAQLKVLTDAEEIASEWVTPMRLSHVTDKLLASKEKEVGVEDTPTIIGMVVEDVLREASGEIVGSKEATKAMKAKAAQLFKALLRSRFQEKIATMEQTQ